MPSAQTTRRNPNRFALPVPGLDTPGPLEVLWTALYHATLMLIQRFLNTVAMDGKLDGHQNRLEGLIKKGGLQTTERFSCGSCRPAASEAAGQGYQEPGGCFFQRPALASPDQFSRYPGG
jgi:hypothetical protein